jgi:putative peptidoglycan lipid II flippase
VDSSIILLSVTLIPATVLLCSMGDAGISILYERGAFTERDTVLTNRALFGYSIGLIFYALSLSFVRVFNSLHDMKTPAIIGLTSVLINAALAILLMVPLKNLGISLATSIVSFYNFSVLYVFLKKKIGYSMKKRTIREISRSLICGIMLLLVVFGVRKIFPENAMLIVIICTIFTAIIYGFAFKRYYAVILQKK